MHVIDQHGSCWLLPHGDSGAPSGLCPCVPGSDPLASSQEMEEDREYGEHSPLPEYLDKKQEPPSLLTPVGENESRDPTWMPKPSGRCGSWPGAVPCRPFYLLEGGAAFWRTASRGCVIHTCLIH